MEHQADEATLHRSRLHIVGRTRQLQHGDGGCVDDVAHAARHQSRRAVRVQFGKSVRDAHAGRPTDRFERKVNVSLLAVPQRWSSNELGGSRRGSRRRKGE